MSNPFAREAPPPIRIAPWLPPGDVQVIEGVVYAQSVTALEQVVGKVQQRYAVIHTQPPCLLDKSTGCLTEIWVPPPEDG